jgi:iron complex transport system permease protein
LRMRNSIIIYLALLFLFASILVSLSLGRYDISLYMLIDFLKWNFFGIGAVPANVDLLSNIIIDIRLPRIIAAVLVGAALSTAGAAFQAMFVNPLVSPGILGVLAGSSFGAALGIMIGDSWIVVQLFAFAFGFSAVLIAVGVAKIYSNSGGKMILLVLGGVISSALFSALLSVVKFTADPYNKLPTIVYWLMGSFGAIDKNTLFVVLVPMFVGILLLSVSGKFLNILSLGDDEAKALGIRVGLVRYSAIALATMISALTVVMAGMIGWVGLIIPHIARFLVGPDNRILLPMCAILGGAFLLIVDTICRTAMSIEIPIGIATSLIGIPIFVLALRGAKKGFA